MPGMDDLLHTPQAEKLMGDKDTLERLAAAPEAQALLSRLNRNTKGGLEQAAQGDGAGLMAAMKALLRDPESVKLMEQLKDKMK